MFYSLYLSVDDFSHNNWQSLILFHFFLITLPGIQSLLLHPAEQRRLEQGRREQVREVPYRSLFHAIHYEKRNFASDSRRAIGGEKEGEAGHGPGYGPHGEGCAERPTNGIESVCE